MISFTFTSRNDAVGQIEDLLGPEGSRALARAIYDEARIDGLASIDSEGIARFSVTQKQWDTYIESLTAED